MSRSILLVEPDVDALGDLASYLRARGLTVTMAAEPAAALERARSIRPDAILIAGSLADSTEFISELKSEGQLAEIPRFVLVEATEGGQPANQLPRENPELIVTRLYALPNRNANVSAERGDFRGDLQQVSVLDLLQLLSMNRRSGTLSVTTPRGAGEVRVVDGEVADAVYRRLEGEKALYRLLSEHQGSFAFASGTAPALRRVHTRTPTLLMEGMRQLDELALRRSELAADNDAFVTVGPVPAEFGAAEHRVAEALTAPLNTDELLDEVGLLDVDILAALSVLIERGVVRRIAKGAMRVELGDPEQLAVLAALLKRKRAEGFSGPARIVLAATPATLTAVAHSVARIAEAVPPGGVVPQAPVPRRLSSLHLDGGELDVLGLPLDDAYSPLWGLSLPGSAVAVQLDGERSYALEHACSLAGVALANAATLLGDLDASDPAQVAAMIRLALESVAYA